MNRGRRWRKWSRWRDGVDREGGVDEE